MESTRLGARMLPIVRRSIGFNRRYKGRRRLAVDGELVAFGDDGLPSFPRLCDRMLHGKQRVEVMLIVFDVLAIDGRAVHRRPYWEPSAARRPRPKRRLLVDQSQPHGRRSAVGEGLRARA